jgi:arylsulfatase A-like enzyme
VVSKTNGRRALMAAAVLLMGLSRPAARASQAQALPAHPNVVVFLMDDLGYGDPGSYGAKDVRTPNIDRLGHQGVKLTHCYAAAPVCTPTRVAFMTGRYQQRVGLEWVLTQEDADKGLPATEPTLGRRLKDAGYATALIGKWHLGWKEEFRPRRHGFDEFFGFLSGALDYYSHRNEAGQHDLYENDRPIEVEGYLTDEITKRAEAFIDRQTSRPFFLEVAYNATHWPFQPPGLRRRPDFPAGSVDDVLERWSFDGRREDYVRMLERADAGIGRVLASLDRHGFADRTLVIFASDNGGEWLSRMGPLFHRKGSLWEGGIRVPCLLRWRSRLPAGRVSRQPAITMDLTATILAAAGVQLPADRPLDGVDLVPLLSGGGREIERTFFWRLPRGARTRAIRHGKWKYVAERRFPGLLFDLSIDPGERHDQASRHPDVVARLRAKHAEWERTIAGP